ncbi:MAG: glycosyltransferase [Patescibacteria group bacterium]|nr:glycosyltransferase [Patescibacteria group bacterium]
MGVEIIVYLAIFLGLYFSIFVLGTFFEYRQRIYPVNSGLKKEKGLENKNQKNFPSVCLIVPCFNEEDNIERTLNSLVGLDYPKEKLEIIVVDDGSKDNTFQKAKTFAKKDKRLKVFRKENGGKYTALNFGLKKTSSKFVGSVDADSFLDPEALKKIMKYFDNPETMVVISTVKIAEPKNIIEGIQYVEYLIGAFLRKAFSFLDSVNVTPGPLSVFRKEVFEILGPYKKGHLTEDLEIAFRIQKANFKISHALEAIVWTKACSDFKSLFFQRLRWRRGFLLNLKDYPELLNFKQHGNLSFLLSLTLIGSFLSVCCVGFSIWKMVSSLVERINQFFLIGLHFSNFSFRFDLFSINFKPLLILGVLSLIPPVLYIFFSKKLTLDKRALKKDAFFCILFYAFLNALWWASAIFSVFTKKKVSWR